jgi:two-component system, cell cycle sensor histidine kinase and response regulator CckA
VAHAFAFGCRPASVGGRERLLVVEDNPAVRKLAVRVLDDLGYHTTAVTSAEEALTLPVESFDGMVTDVRLPKMDGYALAREVRKRAPTTRFMLMSGEAPPDDAPPGLVYVAKPFSVATLAAAVRAMFDAK